MNKENFGTSKHLYLIKSYNYNKIYSTKKAWISAFQAFLIFYKPLV